MTHLCKILWGAVGRRTVSDNEGIRAFTEESISGLEVSGNSCPVVRRKKRAKQNESDMQRITKS